MSRQLQYTRGALEDIAEAAAHYVIAQEGLGAEFTDSIDEKMRPALSTPHMFPKLFENIREAKLQRFPYVICYRVYADIVLVVAVFPVRRDPQALARLLASR